MKDLPMHSAQVRGCANGSVIELAKPATVTPWQCLAFLTQSLLKRGEAPESYTINIYEGSLISRGMIYAIHSLVVYFMACLEVESRKFLEIPVPICSYAPYSRKSVFYSV